MSVNVFTEVLIHLLQFSRKFVISVNVFAEACSTFSTLLRRFAMSVLHFHGGL